MTTITATYSPEDNKLRLYASTRLDAETYARVKAAGFVWAPRQELFVAPRWTPAREELNRDWSQSYKTWADLRSDMHGTAMRVTDAATQRARDAAPDLVAALRDLQDATDADIFTDAPECARQLRRVFKANEHAAKLIAAIDTGGPAPSAEPAAPTGGTVTIRADHLAALVAAAETYAEDLQTGLDDGTYDDLADLEAVQEAIAAAAALPSDGPYRAKLAEAFRVGARELCNCNLGDLLEVPEGARVEEAGDGGAWVHCRIFVSDGDRAAMVDECTHCGEERPAGPPVSGVWTCGACNGLNPVGEA